jgi:hydrocephalus-inducing protein
MVNYRPLIISEQTTDVLFKHPILGDFKYNFTLKGVAPTSQRSLAFKCSLGQDQIQAFKFTHFMKKAVVYQIKVERADGPGVCDFKIEGQPTIPGPAADSYKGVDLQINIKYEPFTIGDSRGILKLTCAEGLEYNCLLYGRSSAPQPQGPIKCPTGAKPVGIDFKNPLNEKVEFVVNFDNSNFSLASKLPGPLEPGKVTNLQIKYDGKADLPSTGRMIVTAKGLPPWIFYLQGE